MKVVVVGGGAAGLMAAGTAAAAGAQVTLFEKNEKVGRKLYITGKGRCNVCNDCDAAAVMAHVPVNPRFLYSALECFAPADVMEFFSLRGVLLKTERGGRVFPQSDKAADVIDCLLRFIRQAGVSWERHEVTSITAQDGAVCGVHANGKLYPADAVVLATGGASYPATGSTGDGYRFAKELGHTIVPPRPSLVPLVSQDAVCSELMGLSLRNVRLTAFENDKKVFQELGELLFTHFGFSGPLVLSASAHMRHFGSKSYRVEIDLKPALDEKTLGERVLSDFQKFKNNDFINALGELLPRKLIPVIVSRAAIDPRTKVHSVTRAQRQTLVKLLKAFSVSISGARPISEAIITSGGVSVREVSPKTMESKKVKQLYFAGELLDMDAYTGGFNLQIAWSTGRLAGISAAKQEEQEA